MEAKLEVKTIFVLFFMHMHMEYSLAAQTAFYIGASQYGKKRSGMRDYLMWNIVCFLLIALSC